MVIANYNKKVEGVNVVVQCYCKVTLPLAGTGDPGYIIMWTERQGENMRKEGDVKNGQFRH